MTQYFKLKEKDIREIAGKYNLNQVGYESIEEGAGNTNYLVRTAQKKYVLTIFEIGHTRVSRLIQLLFFLHKNGMPATRLKSLSSGDLSTTFRGRPIMLRPYVSGEVVENLSPAMLKQIGMALANLHRIPAPEFLLDKHSYGLSFFPRLFGRNIDPEYEDWLAKKTDYLRRNIPPDLPRGLIHGDLFYDNVLFEEDDFKAIIDFEEACQYYKVFDLGMAVVGLCVEDFNIKLKKVRALLHGYQRIRPLEDHEKDSLQLFVEYAAISTSSWRYWKFNIDTPIAEKAKAHLQMMELAKHACAIPNARFMSTVFSG